MPIALEKRIIDAGYTPWDPLGSDIMPGKVLQIVKPTFFSPNKHGFQVKWEKEDCFPTLGDPQKGNDIEIQAVSVDDSQASFSLEFLDVGKGKLSKAGITAFMINLTEVSPLSCLQGTWTNLPRVRNVRTISQRETIE
jgi:hypothetical protein